MRFMVAMIFSSIVPAFLAFLLSGRYLRLQTHVEVDPSSTTVRIPAVQQQQQPLVPPSEAAFLSAWVAMLCSDFFLQDLLPHAVRSVPGVIHGGPAG
jgi:hypothetical protein